MPLPLPPTLEPWRARLEAAAAPCLHFTLEDADEPALPGCRYGGHPLLPPGTQWPRSARGPLHFVGQLDFAELASVRGDALAHLPRDGVLCLFYDMREQPWGHEAGERDLWRLVWTPRRADAVPLAPPKALEEAGLAFDLPVRMVPRRGLSVPELPDPRELPPPHDEEYDPAVLRHHLLGADNAHQVGGHAWWIQYDARDEARRLVGSGADWNLLWQIGSDDATGFQWGDMGNLYLLVRDSDAREGRFERAWLILQCG